MTAGEALPATLEEGVVGALIHQGYDAGPLPGIDPTPLMNQGPT
jgi:hypothetical protein